MRTMARLEALRDWTYARLCQGREMKAPAKNMDIRVVKRQEPQVYLAFTPLRSDQPNITGEIDPMSVAPGIIIAPSAGYIRRMEEQRNDYRLRVTRPIEFGQTLDIQALFFVYEDGVRLPGFVESAEGGHYDMTLIKEGTEEGLGTLLNWMDEFKEGLLGENIIPETDMFLNATSSQYGLYTDQKYVNDKRPLYIGIVTATFQCHVDANNDEINELLR